MSSSAAIHSVHIYEDSAALISRLGAIVSSSLRSGDSVLIIATAEHRDLLVTDLRKCGIDVREHARERRYTMLDAAETLATFMRQGLPDAKLFAECVGDILDEVRRPALRRGRSLTAFGEMVAVLWEQGQKDAALQLEALWNDTLHDSAFHLHCAYPHSIVGAEDAVAISGAHTHFLQ